MNTRDVKLSFPNNSIKKFTLWIFTLYVTILTSFQENDPYLLFPYVHEMFDESKCTATGGKKWTLLCIPIKLWGHFTCNFFLKSCQAQTRRGVLLLPFLSWLSLESSLYSTAYHMSSRNMADKGHVWSDDGISLLIHVWIHTSAADVSAASHTSHSWAGCGAGPGRSASALHIHLRVIIVGLRIFPLHKVVIRCEGLVLSFYSYPIKTQCLRVDQLQTASF